MSDTTPLPPTAGAQRETALSRWDGEGGAKAVSPAATPMQGPSATLLKAPTVTDIGPRPGVIDLERATMDNRAYRAVIWSGRHLQVTLMSIPVGGDIGLEMHPDTDQFLRLEAGSGLLYMGAEQEQLTLAQDIGDGWCALVPAGTWHNITNIGADPMQLYAVYAPAHHSPGKVHPSAVDARADTQDEPADWSFQTPHAPDQQG